MKVTRIFNFSLILLSLQMSTMAKDLSWKVLSQYNLKTNKAAKQLSGHIGKKVKVTGFMIPLDYEQKVIKEFLLIPYYPSCSHVPPPPPNQIVNVTIASSKGIAPMYMPVEVIGKLTIKKNRKTQPNEFIPQGVFEMSALSVKKAGAK